MGPGNNVWSGYIELKEGDQRDMTIDVTTSIVAGTCYLPDGSPAARVSVSARGKLKSNGEPTGSTYRNTRTDADGKFTLKMMAEGTWTLEFRGRTDQQPWRGLIEDLEVSAGTTTDALRVDLVAPMLVKGVVDMTVFAEKPDWGWLLFHRLEPTDPPTGPGKRVGNATCRGDGIFVVDDLKPGRYRVLLHAQSQQGSEFECGVIDVPPAGLEGVKLVPQLK